MTKKEALTYLCEDHGRFQRKIKAYLTLFGTVDIEWSMALCQYQMMRADEIDDTKDKLAWAKELFGLQKSLMQKDIETNLVVEHHYHAPAKKEAEDDTEG